MAIKSVAFMHDCANQFILSRTTGTRAKADRLMSIFTFPYRVYKEYPPEFEFFSFSDKFGIFSDESLGFVRFS